MNIGVLVCGHTPETLDDYPTLMARLLEGQAFELTAFNVVDGVFPEGPDACDGWLVTGSKHGAYEDLAWIPPLEDFIRAAIAANVPLVGICFGHQIIAQALGGTVEKFTGGWSIGLQSYGYRGAPVDQNAWHQDQVTRAPESAEVIASSAFCANAALVYGDTAFTVQWHPEFDSTDVANLIKTRARGVVPDARIEAAEGTLSSANDNARLAQDIGRFFRERRLA